MSNLIKSYYFLLIILVGLAHFIVPTDIASNSAFNWPTADSFHALERANDSNFLNNDFFTNSSSKTSPRTPYIVLINTISEIFNTNYYNVIFSMEWMMAILFPIGVFLFLSRVNLNKNPTEDLVVFKNISLAIFISLASSIFVITNFRYAYWRPIPIWAAPQGIALCLSFYGGFLLVNAKRIQKILGVILLQIAILIHPANTILFLILFMVFLPNLKSMVTYGITIALSTLPILLIIIFLFGDDYHLNNEDFLRLYIIEAPYHAHHYMPNHFDNSIRDNVIKLISGFSIVSLLLKNWRLAFIGGVSATSYFLSIKLQIFAFDTANKPLLIIGPVRYTQFGYFMLSLVISGCLAEMLKFIKISEKFKEKLKEFNFKYINLALLTILFFSYGLKLHNIDNPNKDLHTKYSELFNWIDKNTSKQDVFSAPLKDFQDLIIAIPIIEKRPIFYAGAAPFIERFFAEAIERKELLYGARSEWTGGGPEWFYCNALDSKRVIKSSKKYRLNWVVMANNCPSNEKLKSFKTAFKDNNLTVYQVP